MTLIFVNRFFYPDHSATSQMLSDLAFDLAAAGERVIVIASRQVYDASGVVLPAREDIAGVEIHRAWTTHFGRSRHAGRALDDLSFYVSAAWHILKVTQRGDVARVAVATLFAIKDSN